MRKLNGRYYPGFLKHNNHTLKQMYAFKRRSKGVNKEYWMARIEDYKLGRIKLKEFFEKENKNRLGNTKNKRKEGLKIMNDKL